MLEKIDLNKSLTKKKYKEYMEPLQEQLGYLQRQCKELQIPVVIVMEGLSAAGKGTLISQLISPLDPRGFQVFATARETEEEKRHAFLWRFWTKLPAKGRIAIFDRSWYQKVLADRFEKGSTKEEMASAYEEILNFEEMLTADGMVIIKLFAYISKKEQKERLNRLLDSKETAWRVSKSDLKKNKEYDAYLDINEDALEKTDSACAPWHIIEGTDRQYAAVKMMNEVVNELQAAVDEKLEQQAKKAGKKKQSQKDTSLQDKIQKSAMSFQSSVLAGVSLEDKKLTKKEYKEQLAVLQEELFQLQNVMYQKRIPTVLAFEGWDAGGKGGAIKRLTQALDPRGYVVNPVCAPNDEEKLHHYLWRFYKNFPKSGHTAIFDRSWYGRVMVERIEGFCSKEEYERAYKEMNSMEEQLANANAVVLKFWMHIDKDEQARRFQERQDNPMKQWKITDEDWRNREKWDEYESAVDEMLIRTSTSYAPWIVVEGNDKYYARIKVLKTVISAWKEAIKKHKA